MRQNPASLEKAVRSGRGNLLLMMLLTLINILMICFNSSVSFPFSAFIPQLIWVISYDVYQTIGSSLVLIIGGILCFLSLAIYLPFFFLSKKYPSLLLVPMILFCADTLVLLWIISGAFEASMTIDIIFHIWVLYYLVYGVYAAFKIKKLPPEAFAPPLPVNPVYYEEPAPNTEYTEATDGNRNYFNQNNT